MGDEALKRYFSTLRDVVSEAGGDAYRKGGDETIVILTKVSSGEAVQVAEAVREGIRAELEYLRDKGLEEPVTVSLGVLTTTARKTPTEMITEADRLLYQAKERRNRVVAVSQS